MQGPDNVPDVLSVFCIKTITASSNDQTLVFRYSYFHRLSHLLLQVKQ